jgi:hypothetical protein
MIIFNLRYEKDDYPGKGKELHYCSISGETMDKKRFFDNRSHNN